MSLQQLEHVTACLRDGRHLCNHRQIVDDERHLVLLMGGQRLGVTQQAKAGDIGGAVRVVFVHETAGDAIETCHRIHGAMVCFSDVLFTHHQFDAIPAFWLVQPLMGVYRYLKWQDRDIVVVPDLTTAN